MTSLRSPSIWISICVLALAVGCQRVHVGGDDGGTAGDSGSREQCGPVTCDPGQVCCNESCGICTEPGGACIEIACSDTCTSNADCSSGGDYCALESCGGTGTCVPRPDGCFTLFAPVCGCDGATYGNACDAARNGASVEHDGECAVDPRCAPQDARGVGDCPGIFGVAWNGQRCDYVGGCDCAGADCDATYDSIVQCETAMSGCASCAAQDARAEGPCDAVIGNIWNGTECVSESGCSCVGSDCDQIRYESGACEAAHRHCAPSPGCTTNADCSFTDEYCLHPRGECSTLGTCELLPGELPCADPGPPVCGCDGVTYACDDAANQSGVSVAYDGECGGACEADDAMAEGPCALFLGYVWNGTACVGISGCSCVGAGCGALVPDLPTCEAAHSGCELPRGSSCGGFVGAVCRPDEWCDYEPGGICGAADAGGTCSPRPDACPFTIDPHCGCDGTIHDNECFANMAGYDVWPDLTSCPPAPGGG